MNTSKPQTIRTFWAFAIGLALGISATLYLAAPSKHAQVQSADEGSVAMTQQVAAVDLANASPEVGARASVSERDAPQQPPPQSQQPSSPNESQIDVVASLVAELRALQAADVRSSAKYHKLLTRLVKEGGESGSEAVIALMRERSFEFAARPMSFLEALQHSAHPGVAQAALDVVAEDVAAGIVSGGDCAGYLQLVGMKGDAEALRALAGLVDASLPTQLAMSAAQALGNTPDRSLAPELIARVEALPSGPVSELLAHSVAAWRDRDVHSKLLDVAFATRDDEKRVRILEALGQYAEPDQIAGVLRAFDSAATPAEQAANIASLRGLAHNRALPRELVHSELSPRLLASLRSPDAAVQREAIYLMSSSRYDLSTTEVDALRSLRDSGTLNEEDRSAIQALLVRIERRSVAK